MKRATVKSRPDTSGSLVLTTKLLILENVVDELQLKKLEGNILITRSKNPNMFDDIGDYFSSYKKEVLRWNDETAIMLRDRLFVEEWPYNMFTYKCDKKFIERTNQNSEDLRWIVNYLMEGVLVLDVLINRLIDPKSKVVPRFFLNQDQRVFDGSSGELWKKESNTIEIRKGNRKDVFLVHGHDKSMKEVVARFLEKGGLHPIILHEKPNEGRVLIEKVEKYTNVNFAIILVSPDDLGCLNDGNKDLTPRPRQNVILEWGYLMGKIGRDRVCSIVKHGVDIASDLQGILYIPMSDKSEDWKTSLARELTKAQMDFDSSAALL